MQFISTASLGAGFINQIVATSLLAYQSPRGFFFILVFFFCLASMSPVETHSKSTCAELITQSCEKLQ